MLMFAQAGERVRLKVPDPFPEIVEVTLPPLLHARLKALCLRSNLSQNAAITAALIDYLDAAPLRSEDTARLTTLMSLAGAGCDPAISRDPTSIYKHIRGMRGNG